VLLSPSFGVSDPADKLFLIAPFLFPAFLDFDFLKTLPEGQTRNGFAEIMKISHCAEKPTWDLLVKYGPQLVKTGFGRKEDGGSKELKDAADEICRRAILKMLQLESGNLHEIGLDRVIASGHGISPTLE
jgi:3-dehydroquinate synthase